MLSDEYLKDRFRVVDLTAEAAICQEKMNKYSGEGYVPAFFAAEKVIMVKALEEVSADMAPSEGSFTVPGASGKA